MVPDDYLEWVIHNVKDHQAVSAAQQEMDKRGRKILVDSKKTATSETVIPKGKHKGKRLSELEPAAIQSMWGAWNNIPKLRAHPFFAEIEAERRRRPKPGRPKAKRSPKPLEPGFTDGCYQWIAPNGATFWIPNDISMIGTEAEAPPF